MGEGRLRLLEGDSLAVLKTLEANSVQCCVTSPPYWGLRDYGVEGQLGLEKTPEEYVANMVAVFREVRRVLKGDGTLWLNLGDSYAGGGRGGIGEASTLTGSRESQNQSRKAPVNKPKRGDGIKPKDLIGIPWMTAFALRSDGWWLRSDIIWHKPNCMPSSVKDRPTLSHEYIFLLAKSEVYHYDDEAIREPDAGKRMGNVDGFRSKQGLMPYHARSGGAGSDGWKVGAGRNKRTVWTVTTSPYKEAHFATFPPKLVRPCVLAGSRIGDVVLDPFNGAGTTGLVATQLRRQYVGIDINPEYLAMTRRRLTDVQLEMFA